MTTIEGKSRRELAIDAVETNNPLAAAVLFDLATACARQREYFTSDHIWNMAVVKVKEPRVMGAVMRRLHREGFAEPLNMTLLGHRPVNHARPQRVWRSLVYRG